MENFKRIAGAVLVAAWCWLACPAVATAAIIHYDFDAYNDGVALTSQYPGLLFSHATVLKSGIGLNEIAFPPYSGDGVVYDDGGPIVIDFSTPAQYVSGRYTYQEGLRISAYDSANNFLSSISAAFLSNLADGSGDPGSSANQLLSIGNGSDQIARIIIASAPGGTSFVLDDLSVTTPALAALPEPGTLALMLAAVAAHLLLHHKRHRR